MRAPEDRRRSDHENERKSRREKARVFVSQKKAAAKLKRWKYVEGSDVFCKLCGTRIIGLVTVNTRTEKRGSQVVIVEEKEQAPNASYQEVRLVMSDGSAHITPMCKSCAKTLSPSDYEDLYAADVDEFLTLEKRGDPAPWRLIEGRTPVSHELVEES